jgi:hypothetical protein
MDFFPFGTAKKRQRRPRYQHDEEAAYCSSLVQYRMKRDKEREADDYLAESI